MSGPLRTDEAAGPSGPAEASGAALDLADSREETVGRVRVRRALPRPGRRTVGAWCFADHMGPVAVTENAGLDIGPHPHCGLQTVTWLTEGEVLHRDSLGTEQLIAPGQLNLMTAGAGVSHSEEATGSYRGTLHGVQLWVAQPESTRWGTPAFEHHSVLPQVALGAGVATVIMGTHAGVASPARHDTALVALDLDLRGGAGDIPLEPSWEHALVVLDGEVGVEEAGGSRRPVAPGVLAYLGTGRDRLGVSVRAPARALLIGGVPFGERIVMWWNFVARSPEEMTSAYRSWRDGDGRFGRVASPLASIPAPRPPWATGR